MDMKKSYYVQEISREVDVTPEEYLPALLEIVRGFRLGVLKPADESFKQGMQDVVEGNTRPVSELWKGIDA
ncbi:hypothetical protein [Desulfonatronospira sp. MSAO_Bac3]|uniref:hypothetical protein n=1 Tax=Desulfonatronospira sp. MSAO_Bac3 TaxID=2293857 RepID=UPI002579DFD8|nr:hypothetical protein [Desulfonatronospira sp. MSAO_Bac3]